MKSFAHQIKRRWEYLWQQFDPMTESIVLEQKRSEEYRKRLFTGGLVMYCQPIVALESGRVTKVEALARLRLEDGTMVPPNQFLPLLDRSEMDRLFLLGFEESARYLTKWKTMGFDVDITVNLPPHTLLNPAIILWIEEICQRYQLAPERFTLELLETQEIDDEAQQLVLKQLKELGVKLAVDDLGSGYSSLMRLIQLPFDVVKIEQGLLSKLADNVIPMFGLIHGLIQIGTGLGKEVVVEGIEYPGIIEAMKIFRATMGQGYVLARPMPFDDVYLWAHSYHLKVEWTGIHTYVGALAFQWLSIQQNRQRLLEAHELCPLTPFFQEKGSEASEVAKWHEAIHNHVHVKMNQQRLLNWLIDRAQQELNEKRR
jgi:EAL domain-containing protein (putative c-di-GMP-specific phosphodiesterase class I)